MNINFINNQKGNITLKLSPNLTIKDMITKYCEKILESPENFGKTILLSYEEKKINLNSQEPISKTFKNSAIIYVIYKEGDSEDPVPENNEEELTKIIIRQKKNMNENIESNEKIKDTLEDMALFGCIENQKIEEKKKKKKINLWLLKNV